LKSASQNKLELWKYQGYKNSTTWLCMHMKSEKGSMKWTTGKHVKDILFNKANLTKVAFQPNEDLFEFFFLFWSSHFTGYTNIIIEILSLIYP
jgi:hypothetical protein